MILNEIYLGKDLEDKLDEKLNEYNETHTEKLTYQQLVELFLKDWIRYGSVKNI